MEEPSTVPLELVHQFTPVPGAALLDQSLSGVKPLPQLVPLPAPGSAEQLVSGQHFHRWFLQQAAII